MKKKRKTLEEQAKLTVRTCPKCDGKTEQTYVCPECEIEGCVESCNSGGNNCPCVSCEENEPHKH